MPVVGTKAAASSQGFGEFTTVSGPATYIEDVFSTYLYTGTSAPQTITNGIDLAGKGGLVTTKVRSTTGAMLWQDTANGVNTYLRSDSTAALATGVSGVTNFGSTGFSLDTNNNTSAYTYASWTFRKQPKFFDVVTYTGNNVDGRYINHSLTSTPGAVFIKRTDTTSNWVALCRTNTGQAYLRLNSTAAADSSSGGINTNGYCGYVDDTTFAVYAGATDISAVNATGGTYVAYLFAHNAGGFGLTGTDNVISCGSFTADGSGNATVNLGYEPQWVLYKPTTSVSQWQIIDNMRGFSQTSATRLFPNTSGADFTSSGNFLFPTATGFQGNGIFNPSDTLIYIAIRRGPMKTPTSGTSVFNVQTSSGAAGTQITTSFPIDLVYALVRTAGEHDMLDRLRGISNTSAGSPTLDTTTTDFESSKNVIYNADQNVGYKIGSYFGGISNVFYNFRRAPGFFDEVCYTGTGSATTQTHNLGVAPELMIVKRRDTAGTDWRVWAAAVNGGNARAFLNDTAAFFLNDNGVIWGNGSTYIAPTATQFSVSANSSVGASGGTYVAYLFASCPGVSKVGSYSGTGATQTISCGFAARFVLIKRTNSTGSWFVWDTARGMVAGTDPRLELNNTNAESNANWVYTNASGFQIVTTDATVNASGGSYIYLAIA